MKSKSLKECKWDVLIKMVWGGKCFYWTADAKNSGIETLESAQHFNTKQLALRDWILFAKKNGLKDWFCMTEKVSV